MRKLKKYNLTLEQLAKLFGYSSANSLSSSSAKYRLLKGIEGVIEIVERRIIEKINE